ncbi:MAG: hypothetical protein ACLQAT_09120, partial [Candidatus Binataceae bacterium]
MNAEQKRLEDARDNKAPWKKWGPYLCVWRIADFPAKSTIVGWDDGADRASNDADVSIVLPKIPYGGF